MRDAEIELGMRQASLAVGNLTTRRALIDVRDMVRALWLAPERCEPGEGYYVVGGTQIWCAPVIAGDVSKFQVCSGWAAEIELFQTVHDMLDWGGAYSALAPHR